MSLSDRCIPTTGWWYFNYKIYKYSFKGEIHPPSWTKKRVLETCSTTDFSQICRYHYTLPLLLRKEKLKSWSFFKQYTSARGFYFERVATHLDESGATRIFTETSLSVCWAYIETKYYTGLPTQTSFLCLSYPNPHNLVRRFNANQKPGCEVCQLDTTGWFL